MENKNPIQVSEKLFKCLELLVDKGECGLIEISKELDINKASIHRLLQSLMMLGYVYQDKNNLKYRPSFKICALSSKILEKNDMASICRPYLKKISEYTNETVHLVKLVDNTAVYIDKVETSTNSIRLISKIGKAIPLYCSGVGKAMLAYISIYKWYRNLGYRNRIRAIYRSVYFWKWRNKTGNGETNPGQYRGGSAECWNSK